MPNVHGDESRNDYIDFVLDTGGLPPNKTVAESLADGDKGVSAENLKVEGRHVIAGRLGDGTREFYISKIPHPSHPDNAPHLWAVAADVTDSDGDTDRIDLELFRSRTAAVAWKDANK